VSISRDNQTTGTRIDST